MIGLFILGIFLILYGLFCLIIGIFKAPEGIWNMSKIEGFKKMLGEIGTQIFLIVWGVLAVAGGILLIIYNIPS
jgi:hypothetical protein